MPSTPSSMNQWKKTVPKRTRPQEVGCALLFVWDLPLHISFEYQLRRYGFWLWISMETIKVHWLIEKPKDVTWTKSISDESLLCSDVQNHEKQIVCFCVIHLPGHFAELPQIPQTKKTKATRDESATSNLTFERNSSDVSFVLWQVIWDWGSFCKTLKIDWTSAILWRTWGKFSGGKSLGSFCGGGGLIDWRTYSVWRQPEDELQPYLQRLSWWFVWEIPSWNVLNAADWGRKSPEFSVFLFINICRKVTTQLLCIWTSQMSFFWSGVMSISRIEATLVLLCDIDVSV